jgi:hypothetical protein
MSKTFKEGYEDDNWTTKKVGKTNKQKRQKIKDYLKNIGRRGYEEEFDIDEEIKE